MSYLADIQNNLFACKQPEPIILRDYQQDLVTTIVDALHKKPTARICIQLPTGAGKTAVVAAIIQAYGTPAWFIVPRKQLNVQGYTTFKRFGITCGVINDTVKEWRLPVCVCNLQTLQRNIDTAQPYFPRLIIFDEAHIATDTHFKLVKDKACAVIGVTATPERLGADGLKGIPMSGLYTDGLVCGASIQSLQKNGYLAPLTYCKTALVSPERIKINAQDQVTKDTETAIEKRFGDVVGEYVKYGIGRPTIAFTPRVYMAEHLAAEFSNRGYAFEAISGKDSHAERDRKINALSNKELLGLCTADLLTYGVDIPQVSYIIDLRPTKSIALWYQMVGRGLRTCEGKTDCIFSDHVSQHKLLGVQIHDEYYPPFILEEYELEWDFDGSSHKKICIKAGQLASQCKSRRQCLKLVHCPFWVRGEHEQQLPCENNEIICKMNSDELHYREQCLEAEKCLAIKPCPYHTEKKVALTLTEQEIILLKIEQTLLPQAHCEERKKQKERLNSLLKQKDVYTYAIVAKGLGYKALFVFHQFLNAYPLKAHTEQAKRYILQKIGAAYGYKDTWAENALQYVQR